MKFIPSQQKTEDDEAAWLFIFTDNAVLVMSGTGQLPCLTPEQAPAGAVLHPFGFLDKTPCLCGRLDSRSPDNPIPPGAIFTWVNLRKFYLGARDEFRDAAACARLVADLHANFRFCGRCGSPTAVLEGEHARVCPACRLTSYPRISPAVIMAVTRGDKILLARGVNFPDKQMFSVLAGFVSPGETLEDCVKREVFEETCIRVKHVRYVRSQPWPFPDSLMIGFTAEYDGGEIEIDPREIAEAGWFPRNALPPRTPADYTLAGQLIGTFIRSACRS